jgi:hypothetical protein
MPIKITSKNQKSAAQEELKFLIHRHCTYFLSNPILNHRASLNSFCPFNVQTLVNFISSFYPPSDIITNAKITRI